MEWLVEPFVCCAPMRQALVIGAIVAVITATVGTWVVLRGMAIIGDALAHGVLPGLAIALLLGINLFVGAAVAAAVMIVGIEVVHRRSRLSEDVTVGLLFVGMLALGVILAARAKTPEHELTGLLFGDVLGVTGLDLVATGVAGAAVIAMTVAGYRSFLALTFSRAKAATLGMRPGLAHLAMLALIATAVIASFRAVGLLLVFAFLVAPPATAALVARRVPTMMLTAVGFGLLGVVAGLVLSFHLATPAGATMAAAVVVEFLVVLLAPGRGRSRTARRRDGPLSHVPGAGPGWSASNRPR